MWDAAHEFERAAERVAAERAKRAVLRALGYDEPRERPPPPLEDQMRVYFFCNIVPLLVWIIKACFIVLALLILSVGTYGLLWAFIMGGLEVQSRPIFFDYAPGESMMPTGIVDLRSAKGSPWVYSCLGAQDGSCIAGEECEACNTTFKDDTTEKDSIGCTADPILSPGQRYFFELSLTLPESDINKNLGVFMVKVELRSGDRSLLASSKQSSMLPFESSFVSLSRKAMMIVPLTSGMMYESKTITLLAFDNYVDANKETPTSVVEVSLGVPNPAAFPATLQTIQIQSAELRYGKEMNAVQDFLRNWSHTCAFAGTFILFLGYTFMALWIINCRSAESFEQPYADFFDSNDGSNHDSNSPSNDRWMGVDIEILEDDENNSNAWEPIDPNRKKENSNESGEDQSAERQPKNIIVSDEESYSERKIPSASKGTPEGQTPKQAISLEQNGETSSGHAPLFNSESHDAGFEKQTMQEQEERCLADMVMEGRSKKWVI
ncbi:hypothetical protein ACHAWF_009765 [Thalassiosira exigua]